MKVEPISKIIIQSENIHEFESRPMELILNLHITGEN